MKKEWFEKEMELAKKHYEKMYKIDGNKKDLDFYLRMLGIVSDFVLLLDRETENDEQKIQAVAVAGMLLKNEPISPITEEDETRTCSSCCLNGDSDDGESYFVRYPYLHKIEEENGKIWYHEEGRIAFRSIDLDNKDILCEQYFVALINQIYPIAFPFFPGMENIRVYFKQFSANGGEDDTLVLNRVISDQRQGKSLNLYYKVPNPAGAPIRIDHDEFMSRLRKSDGKETKNENIN